MTDYMDANKYVAELLKLSDHHLVNGPYPIERGETYWRAQAAVAIGACAEVAMLEAKKLCAIIPSGKPAPPCPCKLTTCVEPWEPGCGLGTSAEHAVAPQAPPAAVPAALLEIGRRLAEDRKRNDHHTADPIYTVQREVRIYGLDADYAENFAWIEDSEVCASDVSARLERRFNRGLTIPDRYTRVGYCTQWEFVDAYLSYEAAKERVEYESRKHNGTYRTYVESGCRNHEWRALQAWLLAAANKENGND